MWYLLIQDISAKYTNPKVLEIGVYKGQILSAWALIAKHLGINLSITGITPLSGNPWYKKLGSLNLADFIKDWQSGNFYHDKNYSKIIENAFSIFELDFPSVRVIKGYSSDVSVLNTIKNEQFHLIYIDGDHRFESVIEDIKNYSPQIIPNGFLVMDDASWFLPGSSYHKGHKAVSEACEIIPSMGFTNVLNIGHNRVYQKNS